MAHLQSCLENWRKVGKRLATPGLGDQVWTVVVSNKPGCVRPAIMRLLLSCETGKLTPAPHFPQHNFMENWNVKKTSNGTNLNNCFCSLLKVIVILRLMPEHTVQHHPEQALIAYIAINRTQIHDPRNIKQEVVINKLTKSFARHETLMRLLCRRHSEKNVLKHCFFVITKQAISQDMHIKFQINVIIEVYANVNILSQVTKNFFKVFRWES